MTSHPLRAKALRRWAATDPVLHGIARSTPPPPRSLVAQSAFGALVESLAHQQVSVAAGRSIFARVLAATGGTPEGVLKAGPDGLRAAGLSRPKVAYALDLAEKTATGTVDLAGVARLTDEEVIEQLTSVKGIGVWTAKMFLLFHLQRPDVLPHEDLGLQTAVEHAYKVPRKRAAAKMRELGPAWSPYASYASLTLWNWRRVAVV